MKHLLMTALLAISSLVCQAQSNQFENNSNCDLKIRRICINRTTCAVTYLDPSWTIIPPGTHSITPWSATACGTGSEVGWAVDYADATGCSGNELYFSPDFNLSSCGNLIMPHDPGQFPGCSCREDQLLDVTWAMDYFNGTPNVLSTN